MSSQGLDLDGPVAPPRRNGELVFEAPWQGRAFGICAAVLHREGLGWGDFRPHLVAAIAAEPGADYYGSFTIALEAFLADLGLTARGPRTHNSVADSRRVCESAAHDRPPGDTA